MSNAILEMMACGLPVVATDVGGNPSLVEHEVSGRLVPARRPEALASAMALLAQDAVARRRMGTAARARVERDFSLAAMVGAFDHAYRRLLGLP
jgi:glycosyltransferase involved in cell wall biosynthesis